MSKEKNKLISELRFPEFTEHWKITFLSELCNVFRCGTFSHADMDTDGTEFCIHYGELFTKYNEVITDIFSKTNKRDGFRSQKGDILMPSSDVTPDGLAKASAIILDNIILGGDMNIIRPKTKINSIFLSYLINHSKSEIIKLVSGTTVKHIYPSQIINCQLPIVDSQKEQQKIATCLSSLDEVIETQRQKLDALKDHKKSLIQSLFPQEGETVPKYRFSEFKKDGEWKTSELSELATFLKGRGLPKSEITTEGKNLCIHYGELFTKYTEAIKKVISRTNFDDGTLSKCNDVLMPTSDVTPNGLAKASCLKVDDVILGGDILIIRPNTKIYGEFLSRYIRYKEREVLKLVSGSTVYHLYASAFEKFELVYPNLQEQKKISSCLSALDELITAQAEKIEQLKLHKKGLMQNLFPKMNNVNG